MDSRLHAFTLVTCLGFGALLGACTNYEKASLDADISSEIDKADKGKIPTKAFFEEADFHSPKISPDGKYIAAIFPKDGRAMLGVMSSDFSKVINTVKFQEDIHVFSFSWVNNERLSIMAGQRFGNLDGRRAKGKLFFVNFDGSKFKDFFAKDNASYRIINTTPDDPEHVVVAKYHYRDRGRPIAMKLDIYSGRLTTLEIPPIKRGAILANDQGETNIAIESGFDDDPERTDIHVRSGAQWKKVTYPVKGESTIDPLIYDEKEDVLYLLSDRETGKKGLYAFNFKTSKSNLVFVHEKVDIEENNIIFDKDRIVGLICHSGRPELIVLEPNSEIMKIRKKLQTEFSDQFIAGLGLTDDGKTGVFATMSDRNPGEYFYLNIEKMSITSMSHRLRGINPEEMGTREPFEIQSRDKLTLQGYVTLPRNASMKDKLPMIVLPHGGPFGPRDYWLFDPESQFFASRGYAVLQVNFRGSGGYGYPFMKAGYRQYGKAMQDDVTDATKWAISQGIADPNRICIYGASYGGYASLMGVVKEPDLYRCAVSYVGVADLAIKHEKGDALESEYGEQMVEKLMGLKSEDQTAYSPARNADKIKVPIFLIHGEDDVRVPIEHAYAMKKGLEEAKKPYKWLVKPSEGHGFVQLPNQLETYYRMLDFFDENIGPKKQISVAP